MAWQHCHSKVFKSSSHLVPSHFALICTSITSSSLRISSYPDFHCYHFIKPLFHHLISFASICYPFHLDVISFFVLSAQLFSSLWPIFCLPAMSGSNLTPNKFSHFLTYTEERPTLTVAGRTEQYCDLNDCPMPTRTQQHQSTRSTSFDAPLLREFSLKLSSFHLQSEINWTIQFQINWISNQLNLKSIFESQTNWISNYLHFNRLNFNPIESQINWVWKQLSLKWTESQGNWISNPLSWINIWISNQSTFKSVESQINQLNPKSIEFQISWLFKQSQIGLIWNHLNSSHLILKSVENQINGISNHLNLTSIDFRTSFLQLS